jgi:hypothetical protein
MRRTEARQGVRMLKWTIEPQFRDTKDLRFGMGPSSRRISEPMRRDRLLLNERDTQNLTPPTH